MSTINTRIDQPAAGAQRCHVDPDETARTDQDASGIQDTSVGAGDDRGQPATRGSEPTAVTLADPILALLADGLDDLERTRIANENRLRQLTRNQPDKDGEERGFAFDESDPVVARQSTIVNGTKALEHEAELNLQHRMRQHPLYPWAHTQAGVGKTQIKAFARLLAAIGDPYWNYAEDRPRTVSELWQYCGHGDPKRSQRRKGHIVEHSPEAKKRAWIIGGGMLKAGNRAEYDRRKTATEGKLHDQPCVRCGPSGSPATAGSPWSAAHRHADALRVLIKRGLLLPLWRAARDIHLGQTSSDAQPTAAGVDQDAGDAHMRSVHPGLSPRDAQRTSAGVDHV